MNFKKLEHWNYAMVEPAEPEAEYDYLAILVESKMWLWNKRWDATIPENRIEAVRYLVAGKCLDKFRLAEDRVVWPPKSEVNPNDEPLPVWVIKVRCEKDNVPWEKQDRK